MKKRSSLTLTTFLAITCFFAGCAKDQNGRYALKPAVKADIQVALSQLGQHAVAIARKTVDEFATSELDALLKNNFVQSSGDLLRTLENSAIVAGSSEIAPTVQQQLGEWLPDKSHWQNYAGQIAVLLDAFSKEHPNDPAALNAALETVATYLNTKPSAVEQIVYPSPSPSLTLPPNVAMRDRISLSPPKAHIAVPTSGGWANWPEEL